MGISEPSQKQTRFEVNVNIFWIALTITAVYLFARFIGIDSVQERIATAGIWGPLIIMALKASTLVIAPLGGAPLYPIAGVAFGFWYGFLYTFIGDLLGATVAFFISRWFGRRIVQYLVTRPGMRLVEAILVYLGTTRGLVSARLIFFSFPEGVTYAAGLSPIPFWKFLVIMIPIGIGPHALLVWSGDALSHYVTNPYLVTLWYILALALMGGGGYWFYRRAKKFSPDTPIILSGN
jgi:uncharacterized membrane protein YdjX (TVP38/TMEM64 family)